MSDIIKPWEQGYDPTHQQTEVIEPPPYKKGRTWKPGMPSPNPGGRPKGIVDSRARVARALGTDGEKIIQTVIDAALAGDMQAAGLVLARISPPLKARAETVRFDLSQDRPLGQQVRQVMQAVAGGQVDPDTGKVVISCLQAVAGIHAVEELEQRLIALEEKQQ